MQMDGSYMNIDGKVLQKNGFVHTIKNYGLVMKV